MYPPGGPRQPEMDFDQITARLRAGLGKFTGRFGGGGVGLLIIAVIGLVAVVWLATGIYQIGPGENAALRLFGAARAVPVEQEGLHWWWPGPIGKRDIVRITEVRSMELGFISNEAGAAAARGEEALMISGDLNIVDVRMVVQYDINNLNNFLFRVDDPGEGTRAIPEGRPDGRTLKDASEAALRLVVGQRSIDDVITKQRGVIEADTKQRLQEILDNYQTGINVVGVQLQDVKAPEEVQDAFQDVLRARQERDTKENQALAYRNDIIPRSKGQAERILNDAEAFKEVRIDVASGEASRFNSVLDEYKTAEEVTRQRLYLEAMERILPGITKIVLSPEAQTVLILGQGGQITPVPIGPVP